MFYEYTQNQNTLFEKNTLIITEVDCSPVTHSTFMLTIVTCVISIFSRSLCASLHNRTLVRSFRIELGHICTRVYIEYVFPVQRRRYLI